jgi:hypothetical protein
VKCGVLFEVRTEFLKDKLRLQRLKMPMLLQTALAAEILLAEGITEVTMNSKSRVD